MPKTTTPAPPSNPAAMQSAAEAAKAAALKMLETSVIDDSTAPIEEGDKKPAEKEKPPSVPDEDPDARVEEDDEPAPEKKPLEEPREEEKPDEDEAPKKDEKKGLPDPLKNSFEKLAREKKDLRVREERLKVAEGRLGKLDTIEKLAAAGDAIGVVAALGLKYSTLVQQKIEKGDADEEPEAPAPVSNDVAELRQQIEELREEARQRKVKEGNNVLGGAVRDFVKGAADRFPNIAADEDLHAAVVEEMIRFTKETGAPPGETLQESIQMAAEAVEEREEKALQRRLKKRGLTTSRASGDASPAGTKSAVEPTASEVVKKSKTLTTSHATAPRGVGSTSVDPEDLRRRAVEMLANLDE